ncbi:hypothetical protein PGTUg99_034867 [Puccinia graminis f. sp. tritici]|uniref:Uncharacterized protein n=1 Tax=Puccinia graminis f. sp. tritici TaxID=56615 RepID=A0A5B0R9Y9_PUCGR|nr:hypothetical protein PGTUg99_034867 [Puccinia graminis f. sp. tritici]
MATSQKIMLLFVRSERLAVIRGQTQFQPIPRRPGWRMFGRPLKRSSLLKPTRVRARLNVNSTPHYKGWAFGKQEPKVEAGLISAHRWAIPADQPGSARSPRKRLTNHRSSSK